MVDVDSDKNFMFFHNIIVLKLSKSFDVNILESITNGETTIFQKDFPERNYSQQL